VYPTGIVAVYKHQCTGITGYDDAVKAGMVQDLAALE
jgi:hypothetical protein